MQAIKSSILHKFFVVLLTSGALFTGTAWLANFRFPLAVLQTIGIVNKSRMEGIDWDWGLILRDDDNSRSFVGVSIYKQVLLIQKENRYSVRQAPAPSTYIPFGPVAYRTRVFDFAQGTNGRFADGRKVKYLSLRSANVAIALWLVWPLFAAYPIWFMVRGPLLLRHRRKHGLCLHCGYSLKDITEPRCPECGSEIEKAHSG